MRRCRRPDWSNEKNDYCNCDHPNIYEAQDNGYIPCEDCRYSEEMEDE